MESTLFVSWLLLQSFEFLFARKRLQIKLFRPVNGEVWTEVGHVFCVESLVALLYHVFRLFQNARLECQPLVLLALNVFFEFLFPFIGQSALEKQEVFCFDTWLAPTPLPLNIDQWLERDSFQLSVYLFLLLPFYFLIKVDLLDSPLYVEDLSVVLNLEHLLGQRRLVFVDHSACI